MSNVSAGMTRDRKSCDPQSFSGWALERAAILDLGGSRGLLADIATASALKRQSAFCILAAVPPDQIEPFLDRLGERHLGHALRIRLARDLIAAAHDVPSVPTGFMRALTRIGQEPLREPHLYRRLIQIFTEAAEAHRAHALRYCGQITAARIEAVDELLPILLHPQIVADINTSGYASEANAVVRFLQQVCSTATDEALATAIRQTTGKGGLDTLARRWIEKADTFPAPPFGSPPGLTPITSAAEMADLARTMRNCLKTKIGEAILGYTTFYRADVDLPLHGSTPVVVELTPLSNGTWAIAGVHPPRRRTLPAQAVHDLVRPLLDRGAVLPGNPAAPEDAKKLSEVLGVYRWGDFHLPDLPAAAQEHGEEDEAVELDEDAFA